MEEINKKPYVTEQQDPNADSVLNFKTIYTIVVLNWKWFVLSVVVCLGLAFAYLRYTTPIYQASTKMLIKDDESASRYRNNSMLNMQNLGLISNSAGIDNEMEILASRTIAESTVRDLGLNITYMRKGRIKKQLVYGNQPVSASMSPDEVERLKYPVMLKITRKGQNFEVEGKYLIEVNEQVVREPITFRNTLKQLPAAIRTKVGRITFTREGKREFKESDTWYITINSPHNVAPGFLRNLSISQTSKNTTIAQLVLKDPIPQRAIDYLEQMIVCYNRQANEDKNIIAVRTESFINDRLEKINAELGSTEESLELYKQQNSVAQLQLNATQALQNQDQYSQKLAEANTQVALLNSIDEYINDPVNKYQAMPSNVGLTDQSAVALINKYNELVMERNRLLISANETSPTVLPLTSQLDDLIRAIKRAMAQARTNMEIQRRNVITQFEKYSGRLSQTPAQERMLTQIGRQQEVKSSLYIMLLQKREENSISLAATADKGKLIDAPQYGGKVAPRSSIIMLIALILGLGIPFGILYLMTLMRYKIEGHDDVQKLTTLPILADVAVASNTAKTKADIVVHENSNNQMEEIFRTMRTNLQFMLKEHDKVIMFTSTDSGEGKTFNVANLAISFALLNKRVVIVGLDIRRPRLAELFEINDRKHGITNLLKIENPTLEDVRNQIVNSEVNPLCDILMAGPIPPNPAEIIARPSLVRVFEILREEYDYIIVDTAPVGLVTDTLTIGKVCDACIYVCRADYTAKESFKLINQLSEEKKLPNMGIIINGIDMSKKKYGYYYGYGRYGKYGRYGRYGNYGHYGTYGHKYGYSKYGNKNDNSVKQ